MICADAPTAATRAPRRATTAATTAQEGVPDRAPGAVVVLAAADARATVTAAKGDCGVFRVIAAVGISNTMLMTIYERINEIAMMRSLGMKDLDIRLIFLLEGSFIALFGALIGTFVALILNYFLVTKGLNFGFMMREIDIGYRLQSHLRGAWSFSSIGFSFLFSTILAVGFTLIFINRALKMELFSMMRHN
jgi:ABC-type antimicrobial peptide transport system permease subunit